MRPGETLNTVESELHHLERKTGYHLVGSFRGAGSAREPETHEH